MAIIVKANSIHRRYIDEFIKGLFILFESGNYLDIKIRIINYKYNIY